LRWVDLGARFGADTAVALTNQFSVGLGGSLGFANRRTKSVWQRFPGDYERWHP
jgi:hypothetical protein